METLASFFSEVSTWLWGWPMIIMLLGTHLFLTIFGKIPVVGTLILAVGIVTFAFSTILGWSYYAEKAVESLGGKRLIKYYRVLWVLAIYLGSVMNLSLVWNLADGMNALMAIPNLLSLVLLSGVAARETRKYLWNNKLDMYGD